MMTTSDGIKMYDQYMDEATGIEDTSGTNMADYAQMHTMYYFMDQYYTINGWPRQDDSLTAGDMCYNADFTLSQQSDNRLIGFELYDGTNKNLGD